MIKTLTITFLALLLSGCIIVADVDTDWDWGRGEWDEREQEFADVNRVEFHARGTLYILQGERNALRLEGHSDALDELNVTERNGAIVITQAKHDFRWFEISGGSQDPVYTLEVSEIDQLIHRGHGTLQVAPLSSAHLEVISDDHAKTYIHSINSRDVSITTRSHAFVKIETLDSDRVSIRTSDHSSVFVIDAHVLDVTLTTRDHAQVTLAGQADSLDATLLDHGDVDASSLHSAIADIKASDQSKGVFHVTREFELDQREHANVAMQGAATSR